MSIWKTKILALAFALVFALSFAACGGGDDDDASNTAQPTARPSADGDDPTPEETEEDGDDPTPEETDEGDDDDEETPFLEEQEQGDLINACELISDDEVEDILGVPVSPGEATYLGQFSDCGWKDDENFTYELSISVLQAGRDSAEVLYNLNLGSDYEDVDGFGDDAHWNPDSSFFEILVDDYNLTISFFEFGGENQAERLEQAKEVAELALDRLP